MDDKEKTTGAPNKGEREYEIGMDEAWKVNMKFMFDTWAANIKRTYDEYQNESLDAIRKNAAYVQKILSDAQQFDNQRQVTANLALQNAEQNSNALAKQMLAHNELARDRIWNVDEVATLTAKTGLYQDIVAAAAAAATAAVMAAMASQKTAQS